MYKKFHSYNQLKLSIILFSFILPLIIGVSCNSNTPFPPSSTAPPQLATPTNVSLPATQNAYPAPTIIPSTNGYPAPSNSYPAPITYHESKRCTLDIPLKVGDTVVRGTGPANTPIKVISISYVGETLGFGVIDESGSFNITVSPSLEANHVIGIQLSDPELEPDFYAGPGYTNIPMIGLILVQAVVEE